MFHRYDSDASNEKGVITHTQPRLPRSSPAQLAPQRESSPARRVLMPDGRGLKNSGPACARGQARAGKTPGTAVAGRMRGASGVAGCLDPQTMRRRRATHALSAWEARRASGGRNFSLRMYAAAACVCGCVGRASVTKRREGKHAKKESARPLTARRKGGGKAEP